jgi:branched-chain amino acid transport system permease protein
MYYQDVATLVAINCLLGLAAYIPYSAGLVCVCLGSFMSIGAIVSAWMYSAGPVPFLLALLCGGLAAALFAFVVSIICHRLKGFEFAVATLGIGELTRVIATNSGMLGGALGYSNVRPDVSPLYAFLSLIAAGALFYRFDRSAVRKALLILRENETLAASLGISVPGHAIFAVTMAGLLAGLGGGLYIHTVGILDPGMFGFENSVRILVYPIIGGFGSFIGPVIGASALTVAPELLRFTPPFRMVLYGASLVAAVVLLPGGVLDVGSRFRRARLGFTTDGSEH